MTIGTFRQVIPLLSPPLSPILLPIFHVYILYPHVYTPFILPIYCMCHQQMTSCPLETLAEALIIPPPPMFHVYIPSPQIYHLLSPTGHTLTDEFLSTRNTSRSSHRTHIPYTYPLLTCTLPTVPSTDEFLSIRDTSRSSHRTQ